MNFLTPSAIFTFGKKLLAPTLALAACALFTSCGDSGVSSLTKKAVKAGKSVKTSVAGIMPSRRIPVTEVRVKELKKMPTGADRALAWQRHLDRRRYVYFSAPLNYKAPKLPSERRGFLGGGVLPSLNGSDDPLLMPQGSLPSE